jgi:SAM-dependent methyltransferase
MALGPTVRRLFGPYEHHIAGMYRAMFIDLNKWSETIARWAPESRRILEVGCGEGSMTEHLCARFPAAHITAIDITPRIGRLFRGDRTRVAFIKAAVEDIASEHPEGFDLVILSDVLHHVRRELRRSLLAGIRAAMAPGGKFAFKDWARTHTPIHWITHATDRYLTGDNVNYLSASEIFSILEWEFGAGAIRAQCRIPPWSNNMAVLVVRPNLPED